MLRAFFCWSSNTLQLHPAFGDEVAGDGSAPSASAFYAGLAEAESGRPHRNEVTDKIGPQEKRARGAAKEAAVQHFAIDLGSMESQICVRTPDGEIALGRRGSYEELEVVFAETAA